MAKNEAANPAKELGNVLRDMMEELFGECIENDGVLRSRVDNLGVVGGQAIVEVILEGGLRKEAPYPVLHFHTTFADKVPEEALADLLISLNGLNHVISAGAFPGFGTFSYYDPLAQVYLSYRMPINMNDLDGHIDDIRYYLACLYEQMDIFMDFIMFALANPGGMNISDYMEYLDEVSDLGDLQERMSVFQEEFENIVKESGIDAENPEADS